MLRVKPVFLHQNDLFLPERPLRKGWISVPAFHTGFTKLEKFLGRNVCDERIGPYAVQTSAAEYLASVNRFDKRVYGGDDKRKSHPERVFWGGITIYFRENPVYGAVFEGEVPLRTGVIWSGIQDAPRSFGLQHLLFGMFGNKTSENAKVQRIQAILAGYQEQEDAENERHSKAVHRSYEQGRGDYREEAFGTFGRAPL